MADRYRCPLCGEEFSSSELLQRHERTQHPHQENVRAQGGDQGIQNFRCQVCGASFPTPEQLQQHRSQQHGA